MNPRESMILQVKDSFALVDLYEKTAYLKAELAVRKLANFAKVTGSCEHPETPARGRVKFESREIAIYQGEERKTASSPRGLVTHGRMKAGSKF